MWRNFFDMLRKKYFQTIWKNYNPWKSFYNTNFLELYLSDWKKFVQTNICENFDRKIMATKKLHICLLETRKKGKKKVGRAEREREREMIFQFPKRFKLKDLNLSWTTSK